MIEAPAISPQLLEQTRRRIEGDLSALARLAANDVPPGQFYGELLRRAVSSLAAFDGAIWLTDERRQVRVALRLDSVKHASQSSASQSPQPLAAEIPSADARNHDARQAHVQRALNQARAMIVSPHEPGENESEHSATSKLDEDQETILLLTPIPGRHGPVGVLEIEQRASTPPASRQGNMRFCRQAAAIAADFEQNRRLSAVEEKHRSSTAAAEFISAVYGGDGVKDAARRVANEARRLCDVDRVTVLTRRGNRYVVEAISGAEDFNARGEAIVRLCQLARRGGTAGRIIAWEAGVNENNEPESRHAAELKKYADDNSLQGVMVVPLGETSDDGAKKQTGGARNKSNRPQRKSPPPAMAILEHVELRKQRERLEERVAAVREHGGRALSAAGRLESSTPWSLRGKSGSSSGSRARILPGWLLFLLVVSGAITAFTLIPADFTLEARGTLEPTIRRNVFSGADGVIRAVHVGHGQPVREGDPLIELTDVDLDVELASKQGELAATVEQQEAVRERLLHSSQLHVTERDRLSGEAEMLRRKQESLERQIQILEHKQEQNRLYSPIAGEIETWNVQELLAQRPVRRGQKLLSVADPSGPWELELLLPERRLGHLLAAQRNAEDELDVEFILATEPGVTYHGRISDIRRRAEVNGAEGNTVMIKVAVDRDQLEQLHPGASVVAKFHCGERALGYVLFHDVAEFVQRNVLFRF